MEKLNQFLETMKEQSFEYYKKGFDEFKVAQETNYREASKELFRKFSKSMAMFMIESLYSKYFERNLKEILDKDLQKKKENLIKRVETKGGKIIDALGLYIGFDNSLNGYIKCENKDVKVETIFAGGYHIQCLHYRVLVK